jgi:hypothetical protein
VSADIAAEFNADMSRVRSDFNGIVAGGQKIANE